MTQPTLITKLVELQEENARLRDACLEYDRKLHDVCYEADALREDAERYRIVRDGDHGEEAGFVAVDGEAIYGKKLDDYCDQYAAMQRKEQK